MSEGGSVSPVSYGGSSGSGEVYKGNQEEGNGEVVGEGEKEEEEWKETFGKGTEEGARAKVVRVGYSPTQKEVYEHMVSHLPFRAWCRHCVKGKAKGLPHRIIKYKDEELVPLVSIDYMFMGEEQTEQEEKGMPILVMKDRRTKVIRARVIPQKGRHWYGIKVLGGNAVWTGI